MPKEEVEVIEIKMILVKKRFMHGSIKCHQNYIIISSVNKHISKNILSDTRLTLNVCFSYFIFPLSVSSFLRFIFH